MLTAEPAACRATPADIDRSCRWPVMVLLCFGVCWLVTASALAVVASIKLHAPGFLADCPWLTYGRVQPAAWNALVYGFASQAGLGLAVWLTSRLGGVPLAGGRVLILATLLWNFGLKLGFFGILAGDSTGLAGLELPRYASPLLFFAFLGMGLPVLLTFHLRREREVFVSQWYVLGAVFSFPWLYAAGNLLGIFAPVRGVLQAAVQAWYFENLMILWLAFLGLAALFYFIPKLTGAPLPSRSLAVLGFWTLALFGGFSGLRRYAGGPFPAWMLSTSVVASVLTIIPLMALWGNLMPLLLGRVEQVRREPLLWFPALATASCLLAGVLNAATSVGIIRRTTHFTLFTVGLDQLILCGFVTASMLGALYYVVPRLLAGSWPSPALVRVHFYCLAAGVLLSGVAFLLGGFLQGNALNNPAIPFFEVAARSLPFASVGTLANLILVVGNLMLVVNLFHALLGCCRQTCVPAAREMLRRESAALEASV